MAIKYWTGRVDRQWTNQANWSLTPGGNTSVQSPGSSDDVIFDFSALSSGSYTVLGPPSALTIRSLSLGNPSNGTVTLTLQAALTCSTNLTTISGIIECSGQNFTVRTFASNSLYFIVTSTGIVRNFAALITKCISQIDGQVTSSLGYWNNSYNADVNGLVDVSRYISIGSTLTINISGSVTSRGYPTTLTDGITCDYLYNYGTLRAITYGISVSYALTTGSRSTTSIDGSSRFGTASSLLYTSSLEGPVTVGNDLYVRINLNVYSTLQVNGVMTTIYGAHIYSPGIVTVSKYMDNNAGNVTIESGARITTNGANSTYGQGFICNNLYNHGILQVNNGALLIAYEMKTFPESTTSAGPSPTGYLSNIGNASLSYTSTLNGPVTVSGNLYFKSNLQSNKPLSITNGGYLRVYGTAVFTDNLDVDSYLDAGYDTTFGILNQIASPIYTIGKALLSTGGLITNSTSVLTIYKGTLITYGVTNAIYGLGVDCGYFINYGSATINGAIKVNYYMDTKDGTTTIVGPSTNLSTIGDNSYTSTLKGIVTIKGNTKVDYLNSTAILTINGYLDGQYAVVLGNSTIIDGYANSNSGYDFTIDQQIISNINVPFNVYIGGDLRVGRNLYVRNYTSVDGIVNFLYSYSRGLYLQGGDLTIGLPVSFTSYPPQFRFFYLALGNNTLYCPALTLTPSSMEWNESGAISLTGEPDTGVTLTVLDFDTTYLSVFDTTKYPPTVTLDGTGSLGTRRVINSGPGSKLQNLNINVIDDASDTVVITGPVNDMLFDDTYLGIGNLAACTGIYGNFASSDNMTFTPSSNLLYFLGKDAVDLNMNGGVLNQPVQFLGRDPNVTWYLSSDFAVSSAYTATFYQGTLDFTFGNIYCGLFNSSTASSVTRYFNNGGGGTGVISVSSSSGVVFDTSINTNLELTSFVDVVLTSNSRSGAIRTIRVGAPLEGNCFNFVVSNGTSGSIVNFTSGNNVGGLDFRGTYSSINSASVVTLTCYNDIYLGNTARFYNNLTPLQLTFCTWRLFSSGSSQMVDTGRQNINWPLELDGLSYTEFNLGTSSFTYTASVPLRLGYGILNINSQTVSVNTTTINGINNTPALFEIQNGTFTSTIINHVSSSTLTLSNSGNISTNYYNFSTGTLNLNAQTIVTGIFSATNNLVAPNLINFSTGKIQLTGTSGILWNSDDSLLSTKTTGRVELINKNANNVIINQGTPIENNSISFAITTGTGTVTFNGNSVNNFDIAGFAGRPVISSNMRIYGDIVFSPSANLSGINWNLSATSGTKKITGNNSSLTNTIINIGGTTGNPTYSLTDNLGNSLFEGPGISHLRGTFNLNKNDITILSYNNASSGVSNTLNMSSSTVTLFNGTSSQSCVWTAGVQSTIIDNSDSKIYFAGTNTNIFQGAGKSYNFLGLKNQGISAGISITGNNTFNTLQQDVYTATTWTFASSSTTIVTNFNISGKDAANRANIRSSTPGTQFTLSKSSGIVSVQYTSIRDSNATGGARWFALKRQGNIDG